MSLDVAECDASAIADEGIIAAFSARLIERVGMHQFGEPWIRRFGEVGTQAEGLTLIQPIQTSSLVVHFSELSRRLYLDLFSCKEFNADEVAALTVATFGGRVRCRSLRRRI